MKRALPLFLIVLLLTACASLGQSLEVSGESLKAVDQNFINVSAAFVKGCSAGTLTQAQCTSYRAFGEKFKSVNPLAIQLWNAARNANDAAAAGKARSVIVQLSVDLAAFAVNVGMTIPTLK
jgi:hypothetical protein